VHARFRWENFNDINMDFKDTEWRFFYQIRLAQVRERWHTLVNTTTSRFLNGKNFLSSSGTISLLRMTVFLGVSYDIFDGDKTVIQSFLIWYAMKKSKLAV
jgi:hypothetical protein